jgi:hypothetical protein
LTGGVAGRNDRRTKAQGTPASEGSVMGRPPEVWCDSWKPTSHRRRLRAVMPRDLAQRIL